MFCNFWGGTVSGTTSRTAGPERGRTLLPERFVSGYAAFLGGRLGMIDPIEHNRTTLRERTTTTVPYLPKPTQNWSLAHDPEKLQTFRTKIMRQIKEIRRTRRFDQTSSRSRAAITLQVPAPRPARLPPRARPGKPARQRHRGLDYWPHARHAAAKRHRSEIRHRKKSPSVDARALAPN